MTLTSPPPYKLSGLGSYLDEKGKRCIFGCQWDMTHSKICLLQAVINEGADTAAVKPYLYLFFWILVEATSFFDTCCLWINARQFDKPLWFGWISAIITTTTLQTSRLINYLLTLGTFLKRLDVWLCKFSHAQSTHSLVRLMYLELSYFSSIGIHWLRSNSFNNWIIDWVVRCLLKGPLTG